MIIWIMVLIMNDSTVQIKTKIQYFKLILAGEQKPVSSHIRSTPCSID